MSIYDSFRRDAEDRLGVNNSEEEDALAEIEGELDDAEHFLYKAEDSLERVMGNPDTPYWAFKWAEAADSLRREALNYVQSALATIEKE